MKNQVLGGGLTGPHGISDIGYGIIPENYNSYVVDNVSAVASRDAQRAAQQVLRTDAIPRFGQRRCCPARRRPAAGQLQQPRGAGHFQRTRQHRVSGCFYQ